MTGDRAREQMTPEAELCHMLLHDIQVVDSTGWMIEVMEDWLTLRFWIPQQPKPGRPFFTVRMPRETAEGFLRLLPRPSDD
jgi:hypothetical protein